MPLQPFQFGQCEGKRRVASFGFRYDYTLRRLEEADPIPEWLESIVENFELADVWRNQSCRLRFPTTTHSATTARRNVTFICAFPKSDQMGAFFRCR